MLRYPFYVNVFFYKSNTALAANAPSGFVNGMLYYYFYTNTLSWMKHSIAIDALMISFLCEWKAAFLFFSFFMKYSITTFRELFLHK